MARYGGGTEDFNDEARRLDAMRQRREALVAKENLYQQELQATAGLESDAQRRRAVTRRATREAAEVGEREAATRGRQARATNLDTEAIERNTRARQRNAEAARRQAVDYQRALQGGRDPMFRQAAESGATSQYALRRDLGVGQGRASRLQAALQAGLRPEGDGPRDRPLTRPRAAQLGVERAEAEYANATRELAAVRRRKSATDEERLAAADNRDAARRRRDASRLEFASAQESQKSTRDKVAAEREITRANRRAADIIRHPTLFGQPGYGEAQANPAVAGRRVPRTGVAFERRPTGEPYAFSGADAFDETVTRRQAAAMALQAKAQGDLAESSRQYLNSLGTDEKARYLQLTEQSARAEANSQRQMVATARATQQQAVGFGTVSQAMHRHGALTSEFILAAARGETTLRELGNQSVITAGKFAGWTAAASALYGAANAIGRMGQGAISASSGVNTLRRVINDVDEDEARQAFSNLSQEFNVPIDTAVDAVYRMGQRFHELPDAVEAARSALFSFKTGEVDVATSTENLLAIVNGFGLSAADLSGVYDQINQAQNTFGIRIADTEAGLAKAAGTYRNAGGDLNFLLALMVAIGRATNRSGQEIGTGIARAVQRIREPISAEKLGAQGITVDEDNFQRTLKRALKRASQGGADLQEIATGLFGNQYARLISPVLADQSVLNDALKDTSPEAAKGSAQKELAKVLSEVREQIVQVGNGLERLGDALARSGAFAPLGIALKALNQMLTTTEDLLNFFNKLPEPLRQTIVLMGEGYLLLKAMQRFGATDKLVGTQLGFLANPDRRLQTYANRGARDFRDEAYNEQERIARRAVKDQTIADLSRQNAENYRRANALIAQNLPHSEERRKIMEKMVALDTEATAAQQTAARSARDLGYAKEISVRAEKDYAQISKLRGQELRAFLHANQIAVPAELAQPNTQGVIVGAGPAVTRGADPRAIRNYEVRAQQMANSLRDVSTAYPRVLGLSGRTLASAVERGSTRLASGTARAQVAVAGLSTLPARLSQATRTILSGLGPLDAILGGVTAALILKQQIDQTEANNARAIEQIARTPATTKDFARQQRELATIAAHDAYTDYASELRRPGSVDIVGRVRDALTSTDTTAQEARAKAELERTANREGLRQRRRGGAGSNLLTDQVKQEIESNVRDVKDGVISLGEFREELEQRGVEIRASMFINGRRRQGLEAALRQAKAQGLGASDPRDFAARYGDATVEELQQYMSTTADQIGQVGRQASDLDFDELSAQYRYLRRALGDKSDPASIQALSQARENFYSTIEQNANREVQEALLLGRDEDTRRQAFQHARQTLRRIASSATRSRRNAETRVDDVRTELRLEDNFRGRGAVGRDPEEVAARLKRAKAALQGAEDEEKGALQRRAIALARLRDDSFADRQAGRQIRLQLAQSQTASAGEQATIQIRFAAAAVRDAQRTYGTKSRQYQQALIELFGARQAQANAILATVQAENALMISQAGTDPVSQASAGLTAAQRELQTMLSNRNRFDPNQITQQQANVNNARNALVEAQRQEAQQVAQLQSQIAAARSGDPVRAARLAQRAARQALSTARTRVERLQATLDLINANNQLQEAIRERESARFELLRSQTTDPVQDARLEVMEARRAIRGTRGTDRLRARARYNEALQNYKQTRINDRLESIDFNLEMEKITRDQAIQQLEQLLRNRNLTKQMRRDIQRRIKQLKEESESEASGFDLDVGSIKLPTMYDVRRAWDPIRDQVRANVDEANRRRDPGAGRPRARAGLGPNARVAAAGTGEVLAQTTNIQAEVNVYVTDPAAAPKVYEAIDRALHTNSKSKARGKGRRGRGKPKKKGRR